MVEPTDTHHQIRTVICSPDVHDRQRIASRLRDRGVDVVATVSHSDELDTWLTRPSRRLDCVVVSVPGDWRRIVRHYRTLQHITWVALTTPDQSTLTAPNLITITRPASTTPTPTDPTALDSEAVEAWEHDLVHAVTNSRTYRHDTAQEPASVISVSSRAVVIGASTGGPAALSKVLPQLVTTRGIILVAQHLPAAFTTSIITRLSDHASLLVFEACHREEVLPGTIAVAPGGYDMTVTSHRHQIFTHLHRPDLTLTTRPRPSVDRLAASAASLWQHRLMLVVLTGMGADGVDGARHVRRHGGRVIVQDEPSSTVWGMPGAVHAAGLADAVVPLDAIATHINNFLHSGS